MSRRVLAALVVGLLAAPVAGALRPEPVRAGIHRLETETTYKEYWVPHSQFTGGCPEHGHFIPGGNSFYIEPGPCTKTVQFNVPDDFSRALKAELYLNLWRNHDTRTMRFRVNSGLDRAPDVGSDWSRTPWIGEIPLSELVPGTNTITFWVAFGRGHVQDIALRIHHDAANPLVAGPGSDVTPPTGSLTSVGGVAAGAGGTVSLDSNSVAFAATAAGGDVAYVEFHGRYDGFDEDADGVTNDWHSHNRNNWNPGGTTPKPTGGTTHHIGTDATAPYSVTWDATQIAAQSDARFKVRIVDKNGNVREAAGGVSAPYTLTRGANQIELHRVAGFEDAILHHGGDQPDLVERTIELPDLTNVTAAWLQGNYWNNPFISINGGAQFTAFQPGEDNWLRSNRSVPLSMLKPGPNAIRYGWNPKQIEFGQYIEKPGPMIVLRRGPGSGAPAVTSQPRDATAAVGRTAAFTVAATGAAPVTYQWQRDGADIPGATASTYTTPALAAADTGATFRAVVRNGSGQTVASAAATLTVVPAPEGVAAAGPWWAEGWRFRVPVEVSANTVGRTDKPAEVTLNFSSMINSLGGGGEFDPRSLRVVEVDGAGAVVDDTVPFQFDPDEDYRAATKATGKVVWIMEGATARTATRTYHVYFDTTDAGHPAVAVPEQVGFADDVADAGQNSYQFTTPAGTWYYQKQGSAFSSVVDPAGNDWVNYSHTTAGAGGTFRGLGNLPHPEGHFHPGGTTATSRLVNRGPIKATVVSTSNDGLWQMAWEIYPGYSTATVLKKAHPYWFLYEGTPGGEISTSDFVMRSSGQQTPLATKWTADLDGKEWAYFADPTDNRSLFMAHHVDDTITDSHYVLDGKMTVFGFGRDAKKMYLSLVPEKFTVGLLGTTALAPAGAAIEGAYRDLVVVPGLAGRHDGTAARRIESDDFSPPPLDPRWTFVSPVGDGSVTMDGSRAVLDVPAGKSHDPWKGGNKAVRIVQDAPDSDFQVEAKFESQPTKGSQMQGIVVEQDDRTFVRVDLQHDGNGPKLFAGTVAGTTGTVRRKTAIAPGKGSLWVRIKRQGNTWTTSWSKDGTTFLSPHSFTFAMAVARVGPFAGNHAVPASAAPAFTAKVDYFFNTAFPVVPEDGDVDTTAPVISDVAVTPGDTSATVTWTTDEPASSTAEYGVTSGYGSEVADPAPVTSHSLTLTGLLCATTYHYRVSSADSSANRATTAGAVFATAACAGGAFESDDFSPAPLHPRWSFVSARGDGSASSDGTRAVIAVPGGASHDPWTDGNHAVRLMQSAPNTDIEIEAKFESVPLTDTQMQGVLFEQDATNWLRADFHRSSTGLRVLGGTVSGSTGTVRFNTAVTPPAGGELWLRVKRQGDTWTISWSTDGSSFTAATPFAHAMTVTRIGPFAGNHHTTPASAPAFTALVDYVFDRANPVDPEDHEPPPDTTPPVISSVAAAPERSSATITWSTNEPATSRVDYGLSSGYGSDTSSPLLVTAHSVALSGLTCGSTYHYRVTSADEAGNSASSLNATFATTDCPAGGFTSDDFSPAPLDPQWTFVSPVGDGSASSDGTRAVITVPGGVSHDPWVGGNKSVRIVQSVPDAGVEVEAKFESLPTTAYQMQGLLFEQDGANWLRADVMHNGTELRLFAATIIGGTAKTRVNTPITVAGGEVWLRVKRAANTWTVSWSGDGVAFTALPSFSQALLLAKIGPFAANHASTPAFSPAFTANVDYVFNTASPIDPEDGPPAADTTPPSISGVTAAAGRDVASISWATDEPATSVVEYGTTSALGLRAEDPALVRAHTVPLSGLSCGTGYHFRVRSADAAGNESVSSPSTFFTDACPPGPLRSDDFHSTTLNAARWTVVDPVGDGAVTLDGWRARLALPAGSSHDVWKGGNKSLRLMQTVGNLDGEYEVKFESRMGSQFQMQGLIAEQDAGTFVRADFYTNGTELRVFAATFVGGNPTVRANAVVPVSGPAWLRLKRAGSSWTLSWSDDGRTFTEATTFSFAMTLAAVGPFAGNNAPTAGGAAPGFTAIVDYVFNTAAPISPEDQGTDPPPNPGPSIEPWYGDTQRFGHNGMPQQWVNVVGSVSDPDGVSALRYSLNGGPEQVLWVGPNTARLAGPGDFNVEIDHADLAPGNNTVELRAVDGEGHTSTRTVTLQFTAGQTWASSYSVDWAAAGRIENVAQVVDGKWEIQGNRVRTLDVGYDRLIAIGDRNAWVDYDVRTAMTIHSLQSTCSSGIGVVMGWRGHTADQYGKVLDHQPRTGHPFPGLGWYSNERCTQAPRLNLFSNNNTATDRERVLAEDTSGRRLTLGTDYAVRVRVQRNGTGGSRFHLKVWAAGTAEPAAWDLQADGWASTGAILLAAHRADVSFGAVTVTPV